jgi:hypothetical protein
VGVTSVGPHRDDLILRLPDDPGGDAGAAGLRDRTGAQLDKRCLLHLLTGYGCEHTVMAGGRWRGDVGLLVGFWEPSMSPGGHLTRVPPALHLPELAALSDRGAAPRCGSAHGPHRTHTWAVRASACSSLVGSSPEPRQAACSDHDGGRRQRTSRSKYRNRPLVAQKGWPRIGSVTVTVGCVASGPSRCPRARSARATAWA